MTVMEKEMLITLKKVAITLRMNGFNRFADLIQPTIDKAEGRDPHSDINPDDGLIVNLDKITGGKS